MQQSGRPPLLFHVVLCEYRVCEYDASVELASRRVGTRGFSDTHRATRHRCLSGVSVKMFWHAGGSVKRQLGDGGFVCCV